MSDTSEKICSSSDPNYKLGINIMKNEYNFFRGAILTVLDCDGLMFRDWWLTHEPAEQLPKHYETCQGNIHGHLHNIWHGFAPNAGPEETATKERRLRNSWQRLFAVEYTDYAPIEFDEFVFHSDRYQARGPNES